MNSIYWRRLAALTGGVALVGPGAVPASGTAWADSAGIVPITTSAHGVVLSPGRVYYTVRTDGSADEAMSRAVLAGPSGVRLGSQRLIDWWQGAAIYASAEMSSSRPVVWDAVGSIYNNAGWSDVDAASTVNVPADHPTIQQAIDAAVNGDTVQVSPGTYVENINFNGKAITVQSVAGANATTIDGNQADSVVSFRSGERLSSVLKGFTVRNGQGNPGPIFNGGGGIDIEGASPTIIDNKIMNNQGCNEGGGIASLFSGPLVQNNLITNNTRSPGCSSGGGGISASGHHIVAGQYLNNVIQNNSTIDVVGSGSGGGINLDGAATVKNNIITDNTSNHGGGMAIHNSDQSLIVQNLIARNTASQGGGGGIHLTGSVGPTLANNTIADNNSTNGSGILISNFTGTLVNNITVATSKQTAVLCDSSSPAQVFRNNNVFASKGGSTYAGTCTNQTGMNGNISANPRFVDAASGNYHLKRRSPSINAGDNTAPGLPAQDFDGDARIIRGIVDQGIDEVVLP